MWVGSFPQLHWKQYLEKINLGEEWSNQKYYHFGKNIRSPLLWETTQEFIWLCRFVPLHQTEQTFTDGFEEAVGFHTRLKIKPRAGEWLAMSVWNDNRKCGLVLGLYRSRLKMFKRININASTSALHAEPTTAEEKTFCISWCASPLHLKPYTQTALGSSLCNKPWLSQQGTLRTVGE